MQCDTLEAKQNIQCLKLQTENLLVPEIGSIENPVNTIHRASTQLAARQRGEEWQDHVPLRSAHFGQVAVA